MKIVILFILAITLNEENILDFMNRDPNTCNSEMEISLDEYRWQNRIVVLFARDAESDLYQLQMKKFASRESGIKDRDLLFISVFEEDCSKIDGKEISDKSADSIRQRLKAGNKPFRIVLIGKDGTVKLQREKVVTPDKLFGIIDQMPMRRREMNDGR
jgi:hypothetical protein